MFCKKILLVLNFIVISSYGVEIFDASGKKIIHETNVNNAEKAVQELRMNHPLNRYYFRSSSKIEKNYPAAPQAVFAVGKTQYIETEKKQNYRICLENNQKGFWDGSIPFVMSTENCLLVTTPNRTGSFLFVHFNDSISSDSIWLLNNQKLIDLSKDVHLLWSLDSVVGPFNKRRVYGSYKATRLNKILVVDRTEATVGEVKYLCDYFGVAYKASNSWYPDNNALNHPDMPQDPGFATVPNYANNRSKLEGFEISSYANGADTTKNGYRLPTRDEWVALQRGASKKDYYWGNDTDSLTISQYEWYRSAKERVHDVGLLKPNPYGLYDVMGNAVEYTLQGRECVSKDEKSRECFIKDDLKQHEAKGVCYTRIKYNADRKIQTKECRVGFSINEFWGFRLVRPLFIDNH